jgi:tetratricopeptide (TPR) repeat protein
LPWTKKTPATPTARWNPLDILLHNPVEDEAPITRGLSLLNSTPPWRGRCQTRCYKTRSNDAGSWNNKDDTLTRMGRYDDAMQVVDRAPALDQNEAVSWTTKGEILNDLARLAEALPYLASALALDMQTLDVWKARAVTLRGLGQEAEAAEAERRAQELGG